MTEVDKPGALPLLQQLKSAVGDCSQILELVRQAEKSLRDDLSTLAEVYGVAVDVYGHVQSSQDYSFRDLCVKRMRALCRLNPSEAREFHNRLRTYSIGRADARMYEARAAMEERLGDAAKAVKMLHEGLRVGAQPAEVLQRVLKRLQPASDGGAPQAAREPEVAGTAETGSAATAAARTAAPAANLPPPLPHASPMESVAASISVAARSAASETSRSAASRFQGSSNTAGRKPRILGLGSPMRRLPEDEEAEAEEAEEEDSGMSSRMSIVSVDKDSYTATGMSLMPLSPIKEVESPAKTPAPKRPAPVPGPPVARASSSLAAAVAAMKPPPSPAHGAETPQKAHDVSTDSVAASAGEPAKGSKAVVVNGVMYTQIQTIGRGGSSKVYLVQNPAGDVFALKRVSTETAKQLEAFQNEVILLQQLRHQEYVIQVEDAEVDHEKGRINIVMEAGDMDLGRFLTAQPRLNLSQIQHLWRQMLEAVQVIHQERIVHSDLKPGNFLLVNGRLKVIDFGIAKRISNDTTNISRDASVGTLSYMAPEAVKQGQLKLGRASDIWSLGIILYQMVYGRPPFADLEPMQRLLRLSDPSFFIQFPSGHRLEGHSQHVQAQLLEVLGSCLQRDPRKRASLSELLAHPFLSTAAEVRRETVQSAVGVLMTKIIGKVASSMQVEGLELGQDWQVLADEVWEHLSSPSPSADESMLTAGNEVAAAELENLTGLHPLEAILQQISSHRPSGARPAMTPREKENSAPRQPLSQIHPKLASTGLSVSMPASQGLR
mmetsp:Transcript_22650/g.40952  ORF Transcript_22650/g.40952 Transcript_22650/m.40952 type:complete len:777 (-) Transcript_22650:65-2395(-)|eukprot:CAMPEP_0197659648 /NCGR_PEP_ID=MMETSP1338-20131121/48527_1 /TAXON_ID=43686 ORGANISM="Pelagodinium beii, Strain RCC1491" /NCGR_SAMPLE_ID=MMETSP1338 /ASSEMBLY_ACC=CAM_ASM_000754 /LENGTH=776 /DNA_ID=CAMNT_0043236675 /DNA_START=58 /DNA_END=2388 /DNA_ORIENTATION=-